MSLSYPQNDFPLYHDRAVAGHVDTHYKGRDLQARFAEVAHGPGLGMVYGANRQFAKLPTVTGDVTNNFDGIVVHDPWNTYDRAYGINRWFTLLRKGRIWVQIFGTALLESAPNAVFMIHGGANAGKFRGDAGAGGDAGTAVPTAKVCRLGTPVAGGGDGIAMIEINLP